jgi:hypothetical protein
MVSGKDINTGGTSVPLRLWVYECEAGTYAETSLLKLLWSIHKHRWHHYLKDGRYVD